MPMHGPFNLSRRGELVCGDARDRATTRLGDRTQDVRRRKAQPRKARPARWAREGLAGESGWRRCRTAQAGCRWVSGRFSFLPAEISAWPLGPLAETAPPGRADVRQQAGGQPPSDVTIRTKCITNSGRASAAGMVPGAPAGRQGDSNAGAWESAASRTGRESGDAAARQWRGRSLRYGWCRAHMASTKAATGVFPSRWCPGSSRRRVRIWKGVRAVRARLSWRTGVPWRLNDGERCTCARHASNAAQHGVCRYCYVFGRQQLRKRVVAAGRRHARRRFA